MQILIKGIKHVFGLVWKILFLLYFGVTFILLYPLFYIFLSQAKWFPKAFTLKKFHANLLVYGSGIRIMLKRESSLESDIPYVFCANHTSYFDILLSYCVIPNYFIFMGKQELNKVPLFNIFFKDMDILVDRKSNVGSHKAFMRAANDIDKGHSTFLFPEGTISKDAPQMRPFKNGAFKLAIEKQVPIVPITFLNNFEIFQDAPFWKAKSGPGIAHIVVHSPIETKGMTNEDLLPLRSRVYGIIESALKKHETDKF